MQEAGGRGEDGPKTAREQQGKNEGEKELIRHRHIEEALTADNRYSLQLSEFLGKVDDLREHNQKRGENHGGGYPGKGLD